MAIGTVPLELAVELGTVTDHKHVYALCVSADYSLRLIKVGGDG